jgi:hypothetical protein
VLGKQFTVPTSLDTVAKIEIRVFGGKLTPVFSLYSVTLLRLISSVAVDNNWVTERSQFREVFLGKGGEVDSNSTSQEIIRYYKTRKLTSFSPKISIQSYFGSALISFPHDRF